MLDATGQTVAEGGGFTIMRVTGNHTTSKHYTCADGTWSKTKDYDLGFKFRAFYYVADDLQELADRIEELRSADDAFIVRGSLDDAFHTASEADPSYTITRRKNDRGDGFPAHLTEAPRSWMMIDVDSFPLKPGADLATNGAAIITEFIVDMLPDCFHNVRCFWQLSNSAGLVPGILKVHLFFWLAAPHDNISLRAWFKHFAPHVDIHVFNANQPHFLTDPILIGGDDPLNDRTGWLGSLDEVTLPPLPPRDDRVRRKRAPTGKAATPGLFCESMPDALVQLGDGPGLSGFHAPLLATSMQYAIRCKRGGLRDDEAFWEQLRAAIDAAPKREGRDVLPYSDETYLRRITEGGFTFIANATKPAYEFDPDDGSEKIDDQPRHPVLRLPLGFGYDRGQLFFTEPDKDDAKPVWVANQFNVIGTCEDGSGGEWGIVLTWRDDAGHSHMWIVPRALFHGEPKVIAAALEGQGLKCNYAQHVLLRRFLASIRVDRHLEAVTRGGWHGTSYVLPDGTTFGDGAILMRPEMQRNDLSCAIAGTLAEWQDQVARYAVGNSRAAFFVSAGFAGPLLGPAAELSGGFHGVGPSRSGKTTCAVMAASIIGKGGRGGAKHQWRNTGNGLEAIAAGNSDNILVLDEISQTDAKEAGDIVYMIANEAGKGRMNRNLTARPTASWCIMLISTGELTLAQKMMEAGKKSMAGMAVRLIDVPADAECGMGVFENLHGFAEPALLADHLARASATCYGTAIRAFLTRLVALRARGEDAFYELLSALRQQFIDTHLPAGSSSQVRSVCARFGIAAAAGELATDWKILPWETGEATQAAGACFKAWLAQRGSVVAGEELTAIRQIGSFFELHGTSRFTEILPARVAVHHWQRQMQMTMDDGKDRIDEVRTLNRCGWRKFDPKKDQWTFYVMPQAWQDEICKGMDSDAAARALLAKGLIEREGRSLRKRVEIPEHGKLWVYVVKGALLEGEG